MLPSTTVILAPLQKALASLEHALIQPKNEWTRDASIQRFEYSFELCWKTLKRFLQQTSGIEEYNLKHLFREAGRQGLIAQVEPWFAYLQARNLTSHTYNESTAEETYDIAQRFIHDAKALLAALGGVVTKNVGVAMDYFWGQRGGRALRSGLRRASRPKWSAKKDMAPKGLA